MAVSDDLQRAYSATGARWQEGPARIYDRLAEVLVARSPVAVRGSTVADVGAGTGAAGRAARRAGAATVLSLDLAHGMLLADPGRPPAVVADALAIPVRTGAFDVVVAAFSLNHVADPVVGLRECARIARSGGGIVVGAYAADDEHPVKEVVDAALRRRGWVPPDWIAWLRTEAIPHLADAAGARAVAGSAGLAAATVEHHRVAVPDLSAADLVSWRLGMAQHAPFVATLSTDQRHGLQEEACAALGDDPVQLVRSVVIVRASV